MNPDLSQLRDIHLPPPVSWWPLAPGWWALIILAALIAAGLAWWLHRRSSNRWRRQALLELQQLHTQQNEAHDAVIALSVLLRRVAIARFPREEVAGLHGDAWLSFLDGAPGPTPGFLSDSGRLLSSAPYSRDAAINSAALTTLLDISERWIRKLPGGGKR